MHAPKQLSTGSDRKRTDRWFTSALLLLVLSITNSAGAVPGRDLPVAVGPYLDGAFPNTSPGATPGAVWSTENAFPNLTFLEPVRLLEHPVENKIVVVSKDGLVSLHDDSPTASTTDVLLDLRGLIDITNQGESGMSELEFHPEFGVSGSPNRGYIYVWYRWSPQPGVKAATSDGYNRLSRFTVPDGSLTADLGSELVLIQQYDRQQFHIGGAMFFGPDGYLYVSLGDEGNCCSREISTQRLDFGLWSGVLRIDVDKNPATGHPIIRQPQDPEVPPTGWPTSFTQEYYIPNDNPFVDGSGGTLEEFYALGLRHPWTMDRDELTGNVWIADVGQNDIEEIDILEIAGNYQWGYKEGSGPGLIAEPAVIIGVEKPPVWEYDHTAGVAIIGAGVYRGTQYPDLFGKYLYSDFVGGQLWALELTAGQPQVEQIGTLPGGFNSGINSYLMTSDGRILLAQTAGSLAGGGKILELKPQGTVTGEPPTLLSQTGAFDDLVNLTINDACVPYTLQVPFWSDAAEKSRWMCIPNDGSHDAPDEQIVFSENGDWEFPIGSVLIKHFEMGLSDINPSIKTRTETRFLIRATDGFYLVTYKWNASQTDAVLLLDGEDETLTIATATGSRSQVYHYPSRLECLQCHNTNAGGVLGANTRQQNGLFEYPTTSIVSNQLETLNHLGMFTPAINLVDIPNFLAATPTDSTTATVTERARSYLDSNCAYCHRPGGVRANFNALLTTPLEDQGIVNGPLFESTGIPGEAVIVPGSLSQSAAYLRVDLTSGNGGMPPLSKNLVHGAGVSVLAEWINYLSGFDVGNDITNGAHLDAHNPSLFVNETDMFTNLESAPALVSPQSFTFYAAAIGNPVTPFVALKNADNDYTVLEIGTTRTSADYVQGSNTFAFDQFDSPVITLQPGETIVTGFVDSFPDGTGWGNGTILPADQAPGEDEIWALLPDPLILASAGYQPGADTPTLVEGESLLVTNAGKNLQEVTTLNRSYHYRIDFAFGYGGTGNKPPVLFTPGAQNGQVDDVVSLLLNATDDDEDPLTFAATGLPPGLSIDDGTGLISGTLTTPGEFLPTITVTDGRGGQADLNLDWVVAGGPTFPLLNGSFEQPNVVGGSVVFSGTEIPGWTVTSGNVDIVGSGFWNASEGAQSMDMAGSSPGRIEQVITGLSPGGIYDVVFDYARNPFGPGGERSASILIDGIEIGSVTTDVLAPSFTQGRLAFTAPGDGDVTLAFQASSPQGSGIALDNVRIEDRSGGNVPPGAINPGDQTSEEGDVVSLQIQASDGNGDVLAYSAVGLPSTLSIDSQTGLISGTTTTTEVTATTVTVNDGNGGIDTISFQWTVTVPGNNPPVLTLPPAQVNVINDVVSLQLSATDIDNDPLFFVVDGLPLTLDVDQQTGLISGTAMVSGSYPVTATVTDGRGGSDSVSFNWTVTSGVIVPITNGSFEEPVISGSSQLFSGTEINGWVISGGNVDIVGAAHWAAADGVQSLDLAGSTPGTIEQVLTGLTPGNTYDIVFEYARNQFGSAGNRSAQVLVDGQQIGLIETDLLAPVYSEGRFPFVVPGTGSVVLTFSAVSPQGSGIVLDAMRLEDLGSSGNAPPQLQDPGPQNHIENDSVSLQLNATDGDGDPITYSASGLPPTLAIDSQTGLISGVVTTPGSYSVTATASDPNGGIHNVSFSWAVTTPGGNIPPVLTAPDDQSTVDDSQVTLQLVASDDNGDTLTFSASNLPPALVIDQFTGLITGTVNIPGTYVVSATVDDGQGGTDTAVFNWEVNAQGTVIELANGSFEEPSIGVGSQLFAGTEVPEWTITAGNIDFVGTKHWTATDGVQSVDMAGNTPGTLERVVDGLIPGAEYHVVFDFARNKYGGGGVRSGRVLIDGIQVSTFETAQLAPNWQEGRVPFIAPVDGDITLAFQATSNPSSGPTIDYVRLEAFGTGGNAAPIFSEPGDQIDALNTAASLQLSANDGDGDPLTYGAGGLPPGLSIDSLTGLIDGTPDTVGNYNVTATVQDGNGGSDSTTFVWDITTGNVPPEFTNPGAQSSVVGSPASLQLLANDANGDTLEYGAFNLPPGLSVSTQTGLISGTPTATGIYSVSVAVNDGNGGADSTTFTWTVTDSGGNLPPQITSPGDQFNISGEAISLQISANDPNGDTLDYDATGLPTGLAINTQSGLITGTVTAAGIYSVTVTVDDGNSGVDSTSFNWTVTGNGASIDVANGSFENPNIGGGAEFFTGSELPDWTITSGNVDIVASNLWTAPEGVQSLDLAGNTPGTIEQTVAGLTPGNNYEVVFQYARNKFGGGGSRSARVLVEGVEVGTVTTDVKAPTFVEARFAFTAPGDGDVVLAFQALTNTGSGIVVDDIRLEESGSGGNTAPEVVNPGSQFTILGTTDTLQLSASDGDGDPLFYAASNLPNGLSINSGTGLISGTVITEGNFTVTASVDDGNGGVDSESFSWTVSTGGGSSISNGSFEQDSVSGISEVTTSLVGWTVNSGNVELMTQTVFQPPEGNQSLDLNGDQPGSITQLVGGLTPNTLHTLYLSYADQQPRGTNPDLATAEFYANGTQIGEVRTTSNAPLFITCNGFEFDSDASGQASIELRSTLPGIYGIVVDNVYIAEGGLPAPPISGSIQNGSFEADYGEVDPHLCGFQMPGWLVTRENIDVVAGVWPAYDGNATLDLGGHGPGGIAQTVDGLIPGQSYTLAFAYARHQGWGQQPMTADVNVNGATVQQLIATTNDISPNWLTSSIDVVAPASGEITIEFVSTAITLGGGIILDAVTLNPTSGGGNTAPVLSNPGGQSDELNVAASLQLSATDGDGDPLTFSAGGLPPGLTIDSQTGLIDGTATAAGSYSVTATVLDGNGGTDSESFNWTITSGGSNLPPQITNPGAQLSTSGDSISLQLSASDPNGDALDFAAVGLPVELTINTQTGLISGTVATASTYSVTVTVDDGNGGADSATFNWTVSAGGGSNVVANGSFENPNIGNGSEFFTGSELPSWNIVSGNVDIVASNLWAATDGTQSLDLAGNTPGMIEQTIVGLTPGASYEVVFDYARNKFGGSGNRSARVLVEGMEVGAVSTDVKAPAFVEARFGFNAPGNGTILLAFQATSNPGSGIVVDRIRLE